ncbi:MAG: DUF433 domain-containing protein [Proteobacteria bacterium]|jgi:uncharacterized protein (DUF433 family)|nr:DUF433 domain-containing protein [Pseudomonadota bacterium]
MATTTGLDRITFDPNVLGGRACLRGLRIQVSLVLKLMASGMTAEEILAQYPDLEPEDILQCLYYGAWLADEETSTERGVAG